MKFLNFGLHVSPGYFSVKFGPRNERLTLKFPKATSLWITLRSHFLYAKHTTFSS